MKRFFTFLLTLVLMMGALPLVAMGEEAPGVVASGTAGENITWTLDAFAAALLKGSTGSLPFLKISH